MLDSRGTSGSSWAESSMGCAVLCRVMGWQELWEWQR